MPGDRAVDTIRDATASLHSQTGTTETLEEIVLQARLCLPEFEHVSVSRIHADGSLETLAVSTDLARSFDEVQSSSHEGPCVEATEEELVVVGDARHEQRWPTYIGRATRLGLQSQIGVRLRSDSHGVLCLNLHSTTSSTIDPGSVGVAEHFGVHAGLALGHVLRAEQLSTAIGTRTLIGAAVGIVMERYGMNQSAAFSYLTRQASSQNRKVRSVAQDLVDSVGERVPDPVDDRRDET
jgi:hypothetical protein